MLTLCMLGRTDVKSSYCFAEKLEMIEMFLFHDRFRVYHEKCILMSTNKRIINSVVYEIIDLL